MPHPRLSTVIVAHNSLTDLRKMMPALLAELAAGDEVVIVDSGSPDGLRDELGRFAPGALLVPAGGNVGFAEGANLGVSAAGNELIVLLNPDAVVQPGWAEAIRSPWNGPWAAWMALVTLDGGNAINTAGGVLHFTGLGWAGQVGQPVDTAPQLPREVGFLSGACLAIPSASWRQMGGFAAHFFMYCEDVDLSLRLRLQGGRIAVIPGAQVLHDYNFDKGQRKWRLLERNRWATVLRDYPTPLLALVLPALLATESVIWTIAIRGGWARMKALATLDVIRALPQLARERRAIQLTRSISAAAFAAGLTAELSSPFLGAAAESRSVRSILRLYWSVVCWLLRALAAASIGADGLSDSEAGDPEGDEESGGQQPERPYTDPTGTEQRCPIEHCGDQ
jgi:GT2 family glycosyltransferase